MHKLDRSAVDTPECLAEHDCRTQKWDDLQGCCKNQIRGALSRFQGRPVPADCTEYSVRCAYCEDIIRSHGHIEHFRRKGSHHYPDLTFEWGNLFMVCDSKGYCGHYKDRPQSSAYNPDQLIKPDECDPEHYLYFHSSGQVRAREGLSVEDREVATETIRVFGLNESSLPGARRKALEAYKQRFRDDLEVLSSWSKGDRLKYLQSEVEYTRWDPYATTIKHFLEKTN